MGGILPAYDLYNVLFSKGQIIVLDDYAITFRIVNLNRGQIANDGINRVCAGSGICRQSGGINPRQTSIRINSKVTAGIGRCKLGFGQAVHHNNIVCGIFAQICRCGCNRSQTWLHRYFRNADSRSTVRSACAGHIANAQIGKLLHDAIGQLIVNVAQELLAAHCDSLIGNGDPLLDVRRDHGHNAQSQSFFCRCAGAFNMHICRICAQFEICLEIAPEESAVHAGHDVVSFPCRSYGGFNDNRNRRVIGAVAFQPVLGNQFPDLGVFAGDNVVLISFVIFL